MIAGCESHKEPSLTGRSSASGSVISASRALKFSADIAAFCARCADLSIGEARPPAIDLRRTTMLGSSIFCCLRATHLC